MTAEHAHPSSVSRQDAILSAAFNAFSIYGFRKTSMDDIAKEAGLSRSALYLSYRNKEDILRSLAGRALDDALDAVTAVLAADAGDLETVLAAAFIAKDGHHMEAVMSTPHARDIVEDGLSATRDIVAAAEARIRLLLAEWLGRRGVSGRLGSPAEIAALIVAALNGLKATSRDFTEYREAELRLARVFALGLG